MLSSRPIQPVEQPGTPQVSRGVRRPRRVFRPPRRRLTPSCHAGWRNRLLPLVIGPAVGRHRPGHSPRARERAVGGLTTLASRPQVSDFTAGQFEWWGSREGGRHLRAAPPPHDKFRAVPGSLSWWGREEGDGSLSARPTVSFPVLRLGRLGSYRRGTNVLGSVAVSGRKAGRVAAPVSPSPGCRGHFRLSAVAGFDRPAVGRATPSCHSVRRHRSLFLAPRASAVDGTARVSPRYSRGERAVGVL